MKVKWIDDAYHIGFDRTDDVILALPESGDPFGPDICELIGIITAGLMHLGERRGTDQKEALARRRSVGVARRPSRSRLTKTNSGGDDLLLQDRQTGLR